MILAISSLATSLSCCDTHRRTLQCYPLTHRNRKRCDAPLQQTSAHTHPEINSNEKPYAVSAMTVTNNALKPSGNDSHYPGNGNRSILIQTRLQEQLTICVKTLARSLLVVMNVDTRVCTPWSKNTSSACLHVERAVQQSRRGAYPHRVNRSMYSQTPQFHAFIFS